MAKSSHHFSGIGWYAEKLIDFAEGKPVFTGRGEKPSNKVVISAMAEIKKCQVNVGFFTKADKPKAALRKKARLDRHRRLHQVG